MSDQETIQKLTEALEAEKAHAEALKRECEEAYVQCKQQAEVINSIVPPEAVYSFSTNALGKDGMTATWTIRARVGEEGKQFFHRADNFLQYAIQHGWTLPQRPNNQAPAAQTAAPNAPTVAPSAPPPMNGANGSQSFPCKILSATVDGGKAYWKIKGGHFEKFGVTVYPEVLTAAGFATLDPLQQYDLTGYTATYALKDDGKPAKVTALARAA